MKLIRKKLIGPAIYSVTKYPLFSKKIPANNY